jgi:protein gp37
MSDLFHEKVPFEFVKQIFDVMNKEKHHIFQVVTKRAEKMLEVVSKLDI